MSRAPLIGLSCDFDATSRRHPFQFLYHAYTQAVIQAGGVLVMIPVMEEDAAALALLERLDGVILTGGDDLSPERYGQQPLVANLKLLHPTREASEWQLGRAVLDRGMNVLGICAGLQLLNVLQGGTLYQDIAGQRPHSAPHRNESGPDPTHEVQVTPGSRLGAVMDATELTVISHHHQAVDRLGAGMLAVGHAPDGLIEAVEIDGRDFGVGVQWHPERQTGGAPARGLFSALVEACRRRRR